MQKQKVNKCNWLIHSVELMQKSYHSVCNEMLDVILTAAHAENCNSAVKTSKGLQTLKIQLT